jgi:hypothetical protein
MKKHVQRGDSERSRQWQAVMEQWQKSGQSVREYCHIQGLKESAFYFWRRELARRSSEVDQRQPMGKASSGKKSSAPRGRRSRDQHVDAHFLPVQIVPGSEQLVAGGVEIMVGDGRVVRVQPGFDRQVLAEVLGVLEVRPC